MTIDEGERGNDADRLVRNLVWHGLQARHVPLGSGRDPVEVLLTAVPSDAGLLVMGGYGHSRLREWVFGGFTRRVLEEAPLPVLLAH